MRNSFILFGMLIFILHPAISQDLEGAWKLMENGGEKVADAETVKIYQDGYFAFGTKEVPDNSFVRAGGGEYTTDGAYTEYYDFHTSNPELVGTEQPYEFQLENEKLYLTRPDGTKEVWHRLSNMENDLSGNWVFTGRKQNDEISRSTPGDRRTVKILGGGRFQWIAFNSQTKEFSGTGGGTYTAEDGIYTENIEFFSRDDSRVGAQLQFDYQVKDGDWHHSGKSSKGDPMYEIWSPYKQAYQGARF